MYCVKCGVELADSEKVCPLCGTVAFHPQISRPLAEKPYPSSQYPAEKVNPSGVLLIITTLFLLPMVVSLLCDAQINSGITWSGYVVGALVMAYIIFVLPLWFKNPNPVIFVPIGFAAVGAFLLYVNFATGGHWFLTFAFPVTGGIALLTTAVVALTRYVRKCRLYVFGGAFVAAGAFMLLVEFLLNLTFNIHRTFFWSFYPLTVFSLIGLVLLTIAICPPLQESLHKKFFL